MRIFKSFCENNSEKGRVLQEYTKKGSLFGEPFSSVFYLSISIFISYPFLLSFNFYLCRFQFSFYTFRKCSSSFSLGISAVSW